MARGGINKVLVAKARQSIMAKGQNPSIDAVRVELGNTGSKSTIHRYLKELDEESATQINNEALLSKPIKELIMRLASGLREEAQGLIEEDRKQYELQIQLLNTEKKDLTEANTMASKEKQALENALNKSKAELNIKETTLTELQTNITQAKQTASKLKAILNEKQSHIDSLEEKHQHNRNALAHYRQSVKEQRDQDLRQHEQHVQQIQMEIRTLNQTLSVKNNEITLLNKDNVRLISDQNTSNKTIEQYNDENERLRQQIKTLKNELYSLISELEAYRQHGTQENLSHWKQESTIKITQLETEIAVKNTVIERLISEQAKHSSSNKAKETPDYEPEETLTE